MFKSSFVDVEEFSLHPKDFCYNSGVNVLEYIEQSQINFSCVLVVVNASRLIPS